MSKKKHDHEEHVDESWLVPYADVLTLLLALFIVLFAMSSVDAEKFKQMSVSFNKELKGGTGNEEFLSTVDPKTTEDLKEEVKKQAEQKALEEKLKKEAELKKKEMAELAELKKKIDKYIKENKLQLSLKTEITEMGLLITIMDNALFDSGKAIVKPESMKLATEISKLLVTNPPRQIMVSGHTDNMPINTVEFQSNWDLSTKRAVNFLQILLNNTQLQASKMSAVGHGEFKPVGSNSTFEGRAKNRRVEVLILALTLSDVESQQKASISN